MNEPTIKPIYLRPFGNFCINLGMLPSAYQDALTYEEQLLWLLNYLEKEVIPAVNNNGEAVKELQNLYNTLKEYVNNYFNNLDVQEEINNKLDEMAKDGTLDEIINVQIFSNLNAAIANKVNISDPKPYTNLKSTRVFRKIFESGNFITNPAEYNYSHVNGFTMIDQTTIAIAPIDVHNYNNNQARFMVININTGAILNEIEYDFGHANSIVYVPDQNSCYIGGCSTYTNGTSTLTPSNRIFQINLNNMAITEYNSPNDIGALAYDLETKIFYGKSGNNIYVFNNDFTIKNTIMLEPKVSWNINQSFTVWKNLIIVNNSYPEMLVVYNMLGEQLNFYQFENYMDDSYYLGEVEDLSIYNNKIYFNTDVVGGSNSQLRWCNIGYTSFDNNILNDVAYFSYLSSARITIYVNNKLNIPNPDGSQTKPFQQIDEANDFACSPCAQNKIVEITVINSTVPYYFSYVTANNICKISGDQPTNHSKINGLRFINKIMEISNIDLQSNNTNNTAALSYTKSDVFINACTFNNEQNTYGIDSERSYTLIHPNVVFNNNNIIRSNKDTVDTGTLLRDNIRTQDRMNRHNLLIASNLNLYQVGDSYVIPVEFYSPYYNNYADLVNNYSKLNIICNTITGDRIYTFPLVNSSKTFSIRILNLADNETSLDSYIYELNINHDIGNHQFKINVSKGVNLNNLRITPYPDTAGVKTIYFSN